MIENFDSNSNRTDLSMDDRDIIRTMETRMNQALLVNQSWRDIEVKENFDVYAGNQWSLDDVNRQISNNMPMLTINRVKPVLKTIVGMAIQTNPEVSYAPRRTIQSQENFKDLMNNAVRYLEQNAQSQMAYNLAFEDMLLCGIGCTDTIFNYDKPPHNGNFQVERVFPGFVFWDPAARAKNVLDADWVVRLRVVDRRVISEEYGVDYYDDIYSVALDARILQFFSSVLAVKDLGVVYEYQWRRKVDFWRVENPFLKLLKDPEGILLLAVQKGVNTPEGFMMFEQMFMQQMQAWAEKFSFNPQLDDMFTIEDKADYKPFKDDMEFYGIKVKKVKQYKNKYFRAIITGDNVVEKDENFSQEGFSVKFMSGEFSETTQNYYGLMRAMKPAQRMLNQAVSDYQGYLQTIPKGGVNIEVDAVQDINAFVNTYTKAKLVTVFEPGSLSGGKVMPKVPAPLPPGMLEMIQYADQQIMQVCGVTPELMGMVASKEQNAGFLRQQIKQGTTALASYFDARSHYFQNQGRLYIDCIRILLENSEGIMIRDVIGDQGAQEIPLMKNNVAANYDIIIEEMPASPDEKQATFEKLLELQSAMINRPNPVDIMPLVLQYAPFDGEIGEQLKAAMQPPPPPQPNPLQDKLLEAEIAYKMASAQKLMADANKRDPELNAKDVADIHYTQAKTASEVAKILDTNERQLLEREKHLFNQFRGLNDITTPRQSTSDF